MKSAAFPVALLHRRPPEGLVFATNPQNGLISGADLRRSHAFTADTQSGVILAYDLQDSRFNKFNTYRMCSKLKSGDAQRNVQQNNTNIIN